MEFHDSKTAEKRIRDLMGRCCSISFVISGGTWRLHVVPDTLRCCSGGGAGAADIPFFALPSFRFETNFSSVK